MSASEPQPARANNVVLILPPYVLKNVRTVAAIPQAI